MNKSSWTSKKVVSALDLKELDLRELKAVFSKWQYELMDVDGIVFFGVITTCHVLFHVGETMENTESFLQKC